jgi:CRP/FNR family transcriptional regulator
MATTVTLTKDNYSTHTNLHQEATSRFLAATDVFRSLRAGEIEEVLASGWLYRSPKGQIIYCEGEVLPHFYVIESGSVKLIRTSEHGKELIIDLAGRGDCIGNMAQSEPSGCFAQALENSVLFLIPRQILKRMASSNPTFALDILAMKEQQSAAAQAHAARLAFDTVPQRLARLLRSISDDRYGTLKYPLNQTDIANMIGSSRETVCSILSRLRRKGLLSIVKGRIRVLDREGLARVR